MRNIVWVRNTHQNKAFLNNLYKYHKNMDCAIGLLKLSDLGN